MAHAPPLSAPLPPPVGLLAARCRADRPRQPCARPPSALRLQIRFILLQNKQGKTRLSKYYVPLEDTEKRKLEQEIHREVVARPSKLSNFFEFRTHKVIYRQYAGLFFSLCVDIHDNELAHLEAIHLLVEVRGRAACVRARSA